MSARWGGRRNMNMLVGLGSSWPCGRTSMSALQFIESENSFPPGADAHRLPPSDHAIPPTATTFARRNCAPARHAGQIRRRQMVRRAPARRRRPAPLRPSRFPRFCGLRNQHKIPVTPRGAGHGYVGGCVPVRGGIALSTGAHEQNPGNQRARFCRRRPAGGEHGGVPGRRASGAGCFIRPTRPAARTISSAATSPPTPAARAA